MTESEESAGASVDMGARRADDRRMDDRLAMVEQKLAALGAEVASLATSCATKADLAGVRGELIAVEARFYAALNEQTWKVVTWVTSAMGMLTAAAYFIARNVH